MSYFRTAILLAVMTALFMGIGFMIGGQGGMIIAFLVAAGMNLFAWWSSDKMVLRMYGAREVDERSAPELYRMTRELAAAANLPMPRLFIMENPQPNAFATGRNPQNGAVAVTTGLMQLVNKEEVAGVIAHELAHIKNRDTLLMTVTATIAGAISMVANVAMFSGDAATITASARSARSRSSFSRRSPLGSCRWRSAGRANTRPTGWAPRSAAIRSRSPPP